MLHFVPSVRRLIQVALFTLLFPVVGMASHANAEVRFGAFEDPLRREGVRDIAVGDFNKDGKRDLIVANEKTAGVVVYDNDGHGGYRESSKYLQHNLIRSVAVGDFNADGVDDLVAVQHTAPSTIFILQGDPANGGFMEAASVALSIVSAAGPVDVITGDFNGDENLDIATANSLSNNITLWFGKGDMSFRGLQSIPSGQDPAQLRAVDVDHDGVDDLLVRALKEAGLTYIRGLRDSFPSSGEQIFSDVFLRRFVTGDIDSDGIEDLVICDSAKITVYKGSTDGRFAHVQTVTSENPIYNVELADANLDGKLDLFFLQGYPHKFIVLGNTGQPDYFQPVLAEVPLKEEIESFSVEDLDGNSQLDAILTSPYNKRITLMENISQPRYFKISAPADSFGEVETLSAKTQQITLHNPDNMVVGIHDLWLAGEGRKAFDIQNVTCGDSKPLQDEVTWTLLPLSSCEVNITFQAEKTGSYQALLKVATNASSTAAPRGVYQHVLSATAVAAQTDRKADSGNMNTEEASPLKPRLSFLKQRYSWNKRHKKSLSVAYRSNFTGKVTVLLRQCSREKTGMNCSKREQAIAVWDLHPGIGTGKVSFRKLRKLRKGTYQMVVRKQEISLQVPTTLVVR